MATPDSLQRHWRANRWLTALLLLPWFVVTFGVAYFARSLDFDFFGWPFGHWVGAQGALVLYVLLVWAYARRMSRLDREHGLHDEDET